MFWSKPGLVAVSVFLVVLLAPRCSHAHTYVFVVPGDDTYTFRITHRHPAPAHQGMASGVQRFRVHPGSHLTLEPDEDRLLPSLRNDERESEAGDLGDDSEGDRASGEWLGQD